MRKCEKFFETLAQSGLAVTYSEVRLQTDYSEVLPNEVSTEARFSRSVPMKIPISSAAMDTVTESRMAIALALLGGIGVVHKNLTPKQQGDEVRRVKYHLSGKISDPITVRGDVTLESIEIMRQKKHFSFHSFPVVDESGKLVGLLTENDFAFGTGSQRAEKVMTRELMTASPETSIDEAYRLMRDAKKKVLPLVDGKGLLAGMYLFSDLNRIKFGSSMHNVDGKGRLIVGAAVGVGKDAFERLETLRGYVDVIVIDTAHADSKAVFETLRELKKSSDIDIVAGNISRGESARRLVDCGADGVRVGQGPGSICTTRIVAGIGCPQVTAVYSVAKALEGTDVPICADGGIEDSGDIPIAIGAGAHSVMLGKLLAGTKEAPGEVDFQTDGTGPVKHYWGMGSLRALEENEGSRSRYHQDDAGKDKLVPEGVEAVVPYIGELENIMRQYVGGLRKGMGYVGAATIEELRQKADFYRITGAGLSESRPHGVRIVRDAPNYRRSDHDS